MGSRTTNPSITPYSQISHSISTDWCSGNTSQSVSCRYVRIPGTKWLIIRRKFSASQMSPHLLWGWRDFIWRSCHRTPWWKAERQNSRQERTDHPLLGSPLSTIHFHKVHWSICLTEHSRLNYQRCFRGVLAEQGSSSTWTLLAHSSQQQTHYLFFTRTTLTVILLMKR